MFCVHSNFCSDQRSEDKMATSSHLEYRINGIINSAQKMLKEKATLLEDLASEHKKLSEEYKQGNAEYLEALHQNNILLISQKVMKLKVDNDDAKMSNLEDRNDELHASVKQMEQNSSLFTMSRRFNSEIINFEMQTEEYKQNYLDINKYCFSESLDDIISNITKEIMTKTAENENLDQEIASLVVVNDKYIEEGYEDLQLAQSTLKMIEDENFKAKAHLQELKSKLESS